MPEPRPPLLADVRQLLDDPVVLHETHGSWVLVGADRALKIKKPVVLPFLDYGTLERRRAACEAELALNRRLAPDVYREVVAIVPEGDGHALAAAGDPRACEYALVMRRYEEADTLAARVADGLAGPGELTRIGAWLAAFHARAERVTDGGGAEPVKRWLDDDQASLRALAPPCARRRLGHAERVAAVFLGARWDELDGRARRGRVRDGHGDLRLEHVLLEGEAILAVDCIEFDPGLRRIDVAADLAFLVMELEDAGRADLAEVLVAAYRAADGDPGDDALLAWLAAYRAQVRAKVALLRGAAGDAERLLATGERLLWRVHGPLTIAIAGLSATGKSTVAATLAARSGLPVHASDLVRKAQAGVAQTARAPAAAYRPERNLAVYAELGRRAAGTAGGSVVDATFRTASERAAFADAHGRDRPVLYVECLAPLAVRLSRARLRERDPGRVSDADAAVAAAQAWEPLDEVAPSEHVVVRTDDDVERAVDAIADALDRRLATY